MAEQQLGINVWLRDTVVPGLERMQRAFAETSRKANEAFIKAGTGLAKFDKDIDRTKRGIEKLQLQLAELGKMKATPEVELKTAQAKAELKLLEARLAKLDKDRINVKVDLDTRGAMTRLGALQVALTGMSKRIEGANDRMGLFGKLLSFTTLALTPLVTTVNALAGAVTALASSLILAATSLGGALLAAVYQVIPALGLLVAAFVRVGDVFKSVQAEEKKATQGAEEHTDALVRQQHATQNLIRAQEQLSDAHRNLSEARRQAKRDLEDLATAERRVRVEQENARLAMVGARRSARAALGSGSFLEFEQAQQGVVGADLSARETALQGQRTLQDAARTRSEGIAGNRQVVVATRALRDATWALADAHRDLAKAQKDQGSSANAAAEANKKLNDTERALRDAIIAMRDAWKSVGRDLTNPIIDSFTQAVRKITKILRDPEMMAAAKEMSAGVAESINILTSEITSPRNLETFKVLMKQAAENLPALTRGIADLLTALQSYARAFNPTLRLIIGGFSSWSKGLKEATADQGRLNEMVAKLQPHLEAWGHLLGSLWNLLKVIVSLSAETGRVLTEDIANKFDEWAAALEMNREEAEAFFQGAVETTKVLTRAIGELVAVLFRSTSFGWVQLMAVFIEEVFAPALENAINIVWTFSGILTTFLSLPVIRDITQWAVTFLIVNKALGGVLLVLEPLTKALRILMLTVGGLSKAFIYLWGTSLGPYVIVIGAIVVALVILEKKFGIVTKTINFLRDVAENVLNWLKANWKEALLLVFTGPFGAIVLAFHRWGDQILDFFKSLPGKVWNLMKDVGSAMADALADGFKSALDALPGSGALKRFLGLDDGPSPQEVANAFGYNAGTAFGYDLPAADTYARGGMVPATPGGRRAIIGEGGHDEYVISTDPRHRSRSMGLLSAAANRISPYPHGGSGGGSFGNPSSIYDRGPRPGLTPNDKGTSGYYALPASDSIRANLAGVNKALVNWVVGLIQRVHAGKHLWIGTGKVGHSTYVAGTSRRSAHSVGLAVDVNSDLLPKYGDQTPDEDYPLDRFARLARLGLGLPDGIQGLVSGQRGQVIWRTNQGGNHYNHVHVGFTGANVQPSSPGAIPNADPYGPTTVNASATTTSTTRPETREEYYRRVTGFSRDHKAGRQLRPFLDASYVTNRQNVTKTTRAAESSGGAQELSVERSGGGSSQNIALGQQMASQYGWTGKEWLALKQLWNNESGWRTDADNPTSDAYGIPQAITSLHKLPSDYKTNPKSQIAWGLNYIKGKYGSPSKALAFWNRTDPRPYPGHWYESGGEVRGREGQPRTIVAHAGEMVINRGQQAMLGGAKYLRKLFGQRTDTGHFADGGFVSSRAGTGPNAFLSEDAGITSTLNITKSEAGRDLARLNKLITRLNVGDEVKTAGNLVSTLNVLLEAVEERLTVYTAAMEKAKLTIDTRAKTRTFAFVGGVATQLADGTTQVQQQIGDLNEERTLNQQRIGQTSGALRSAQVLLRRAQVFARRNPKSTVAQRRLEQAEKAVNLFSGQLQGLVGDRADLAAQAVGLQRTLSDRVISDSGTSLTTLDALISRASARGQSTTSLVGQRGGLLNAQLQVLAEQRQAAYNRGDTDYAEELRKQMESLDTAIIETEQSRINAAIEDVKKQSSTTNRRLDLAERIAKFLGQDVGGLIEDRITAIRNEIGGLTAQIGAAVTSGNQTLADELRDQIAELNQEISEQYRRKFDEARSAADKTFGFRSSLNDVALNIANLSGPGFTPNLAAVRSVLAQRLSLLGARGSELQAQLAGAYGTGDQDAIRELTLAIEENKLAVLQNSQQLEEVTGRLTDQTWTSSAWEQFRIAIFNGLGGLVPGMTTPSLQAGSVSVGVDPSTYLPSGSSVLTPTTNTDVKNYITVNSPTPVIDPMIVAQDIGYELRNA